MTDSVALDREVGWRGEVCGARHKGMLCDRQRYHTGDHVDIFGPLPDHTWPQAETPPRRPWVLLVPDPEPRHGGRLPDPGLGAVCARCGEPREAHGGSAHLGACPDQSGLHARRFQIRPVDREGT